MLTAFTTANDLLHDFSRLNASFQENGYLFFRNVLDGAQVLRVKDDFVGVLQRQGIAQAGQSEPIWTGAPLEQIDDVALYGLDSYNVLIESEGMRGLMQQVFGGPVSLFKGTNIRYSLPHDSAYLTPPHQDHFFIRAHSDFRTLWVPLMDIDAAVGGLALAAGSHRQGLREHREQKGVLSYQMKGRTQRGVSLEAISEPWCTVDYRPGDLLVFHSLMLHRALPNESDRIRLSLDARCQPATTPTTWQAERTIPEQRHYRQEVRRLALEEGATEEQFEAAIIEMMKRGCDPDRAQIQALLNSARGAPAGLAPAER
jgi:1-deoxypentalenic acid 11beta-hydroxylase